MIELSNNTLFNKKDLYTMNSNEVTVDSDINQVQIDNLFVGNSFQAKLSYTDYCAITQDFATMHMNEDVL